MHLFFAVSGKFVPLAIFNYLKIKMSLTVAFVASVLEPADLNVPKAA